MVAPQSGHARSAGRIKGFVLTLLALLAVLAVTGFVARDRINAFLDGQNFDRMAARIEGDLLVVKMATSYYAAMNGGQEALSIEAFDDQGIGKGQIFDPSFTSMSRPIPPAPALKKGAAVRYELLVDDLTGGRGIDRLVVLRDVLPGVCQAYAKFVKQPGDPLNPDPENRYPGDKGCTRGEDDDALRIYTVLYRR